MEAGDVMGMMIAVGAVFIGLPWIILHHVTKWKTAATLTSGDEALLDELYQLARRLDQRMETVERLAAADSSDFAALLRETRAIGDHARDDVSLDAFETRRMQAQKQGIR